jgi:hypothetical protein
MSRIADLVARGVRITVGDLPEGTSSEIPADFFEAAELRAPSRFDAPADVQEFADVYAQADLPAPYRGYGVDKMAEILESKRLSALPREVRIAAVMASLEAASVSLPQVLKDAALRERALEAFVHAKEREAEALRHRNDARVLGLREEIESFVGEKNREIEALKRASDSAGSAFSQLQLRKRQEEERLREVLAHFTSDAENPVPRAANAKPAGGA